MAFSWTGIDLEDGDPIVADDLASMRGFVDSLGVSTDLGAFTWTNTPVATDVIKAVDHQEIRDNLDLAESSNSCHTQWGTHYSSNEDTQNNYTRVDHHTAHKANYEYNYQYALNTVTQVNTYTSYHATYDYAHKATHYYSDNSSVNGGHDGDNHGTFNETHDSGYQGGDG